MAARSARRELTLGALALGGLGAVGTAGYMWIEGWSGVDAFYMTFITLTTIGFSEVQPLSTPGKLFTVALATVGIGTFATIASRTIQILVASRAVRQRLMKRRLDALDGHYIVCGCGRLGGHVVRTLRDAHAPLVVVDRDPDALDELREVGALVVVGDATEDAVLARAGIARAAGLVLTLPDDADNVFVALTAREVRGDDLFIVTQAKEQASASKLRRAGADSVVSPIEIGAGRIAQMILRPTVSPLVHQMRSAGGPDVELDEVTVGVGSALDGRSLLDIDFGRRYDAIVVAALDAGARAWRFNPDAMTPLSAGDTLMVLAAQDQLAEVRTQAATRGA